MGSSIGFLVTLAARFTPSCPRKAMQRQTGCSRSPLTHCGHDLSRLENAGSERLQLLRWVRHEQNPHFLAAAGSLASPVPSQVICEPDGLRQVFINRPARCAGRRPFGYLELMGAGNDAEEPFTAGGSHRGGVRARGGDISPCGGREVCFLLNCVGASPAGPSERETVLGGCDAGNMDVSSCGAARAGGVRQNLSGG